MPKPVLSVVDGGQRVGRAWLEELYSKYGGTVYSRCRYLLKSSSAAEDAMQDVFAKAMINERHFRREASPLTWLLKIATHHCLNQLRGEKAAWHDQYEQQQVVRGEAHGGASMLEARDLVHKALKAFDLETQLAVVHYYLDEMTLEEVAAMLERSVPTIRKRLRTFAEQTSISLREDVGALT